MEKVYQNSERFERSREKQSSDYTEERGEDPEQRRQSLTDEAYLLAKKDRYLWKMRMFAVSCPEEGENIARFVDASGTIQTDNSDHTCNSIAPVRESNQLYIILNFIYITVTNES